MAAERLPIVLTGASRGLGRALARALAERGHGLILGARSEAALAPVVAELAGLAEVRTVAGDLADPATHRAFAAAAAEVGPLHALVNNAALLGPTPLPALSDYPLDELMRVFQVNAWAPLALVQALKPCLGAGARILNVSSDAAPASYPQWGGYGMSKAALDHLSGTLAAEHPEWRVYWVDPGEMRTDMFRSYMPDTDLSYLEPPEAAVPRFLELLEGEWPSGRYLAQSAPADPGPGFGTV